MHSEYYKQHLNILFYTAVKEIAKRSELLSWHYKLWVDWFDWYTDKYSDMSYTYEHDLKNKWLGATK